VLTSRVLVPVDDSKLSASVLETAAPILARPGNDVVLLRVLRVGESRSEALVRLEALAAGLGARGVNARAEVAIGDTTDVIVARARQGRTTLVAMATHGRRGIDRLVHSSVAEQVLRRSPVPVLLANPLASAGQLGLRKILVPLDGSEVAASALVYAVELAREHGSEILLFHVVDVRPLDSPVATAEAFSRVGPLLDSARRSVPAGITVRTSTGMGLAADAILEAIRRESVDLLCMTTHGRSGPSRWVLGSVAETVLRRSPVPLLARRYSGEVGAIAA
jgi:nucleotide-binding universal stress UspA family protein